jgi:GLPGLI family protein
MLRKILTITLFVCLTAISLSAQVSEGVIHYELRRDVHRNIPADREDLRAMVPQFRSDNYVLFFNSEERFYRPFVDETIPVQGRGGPRNRTPQIEVYVNLPGRETIIGHEFMGRNYLISEELEIAPWKLGNEFMDIAGYRCQMAWYVDTVANEEVTAWFTVGLQPFLGPDQYNSLPGTILALDVNNGEKVWIARKIETRKLQRDDIKKPSRGERTTRENYRKLVEEQTQRMRSGGGVRF